MEMLLIGLFCIIALGIIALGFIASFNHEAAKSQEDEFANELAGFLDRLTARFEDIETRLDNIEEEQRRK